MLKRRIISDPDMRIRCACLAIVDGFLVPTSHYPKIVKAHAEMAEDGLLYALQLVVLQAAPSIQEGHVVGETIESESEEAEDNFEEAPRDSVAFKLGNVKELDAKCSVRVATIICPDLDLDPEEDLSWSEDDEDERVDNILMKGKPSKNTGRVRTKHQRPVPEEGSSSGTVSMDSISRMLDKKLEAQGKLIIVALTDWFIKNIVIEGELSKDPASGGVSNPEEVGRNEPNDDFGFDALRRPSSNVGSNGRQRNSNVQSSVDEILSYYTDKVPSGVGLNVSERDIVELVEDDVRSAGGLSPNVQRDNVEPVGDDVRSSGDMSPNPSAANNVREGPATFDIMESEDNPGRDNVAPMEDHIRSEVQLSPHVLGAKDVTDVSDPTDKVVMVYNLVFNG
ncbi:hypothetical protein AtEden1_Chr4g0281681 [Arabidopsis thaliana]